MNKNSIFQTKMIQTNISRFYSMVQYNKFFQLVIRAHDRFYPNAKAETRVTINVIRNPNAPRFDQSTYTVTVRESFPVGSLIVNPTAEDRDQVKIKTCNLTFKVILIKITLLNF